MLNESQQKPKPRRQHSTHKKKDRMKQTMSKSKSKKGRKRRRKISQHQERKKEDSTLGESAYFRLAWSARGGVPPRRNHRTTESATKESRGAKRKANKAIQETNGNGQTKRQNEKGKRRTRRKGRGKTRKKMKGKKRKKNRQGCPLSLIHI